RRRRRRPRRSTPFPYTTLFRSRRRCCTSIPTRPPPRPRVRRPPTTGAGRRHDRPDADAPPSEPAGGARSTRPPREGHVDMTMGGVACYGPFCDERGGTTARPALRRNRPPRVRRSGLVHSELPHLRNGGVRRSRMAAGPLAGHLGAVPDRQPGRPRSRALPDLPPLRPLTPAAAGTDDHPYPVTRVSPPPTSSTMAALPPEPAAHPR